MIVIATIVILLIVIAAVAYTHSNSAGGIKGNRSWREDNPDDSFTSMINTALELLLRPTKAEKGLSTDTDAVPPMTWHDGMQRRVLEKV